STLTPTQTGTSPTIDPAVATQWAEFGLVFTNTLHVPTAGTYHFSTRSRNGSKLWIDGTLVVDNDGVHPATTVEGSIALAAGDHALRVEYFGSIGQTTLEVGYWTGIAVPEPIPADGALQFMSGDPAVIGAWGPVIQWPEIAISAANLPDGRVLTWSSTEIDAFPSYTQFSHASIFDPTSGSFVPVDNDFHDMFCAGLATLENGTIVAAGGNPSDRRVSAFNPATLAWSPLANMIDFRWYGMAATLPDNTVWASF